MRKTVYGGNMKIRDALRVASVIALLFSASCSTTYTLYSVNIFNGRSALKQGNYEDAKRYFFEAAEQIRDARSLAYLASAEYKINDLDGAEKIIREAEKADSKYQGFSHLRILGYKALILLKKHNSEGFDALKEYIDAYACVYPLPTLQEVDKMWIKKDIRFGLLEKLIEEQVSTYDDDIEQYINTRTGFYQRYPSSGTEF